jgi:lactoylglutathione lyase
MDVVHTALWVSDLDATKRFYEDVLGLSFSRQFDGDDGVVNYFVVGEGSAELQFKADPAESRDISPDGIAHVALTVDDLEATLAAVAESTGTVTDGPIDHEDVRIAFGEDPDGYGLEFIEP